MVDSNFFLGCPVWSCPHWKGSVYSPRAKRDRWLADYSRAFNTVEGNSTFYAIPSIETFERWAEQTVDGFQFALKFPREITHDCRLAVAEGPTEAFLEGLQILRSNRRLGPSFLQLPPDFGPSEFKKLATYLESLPSEFPYAVEVRHLDFFRDPLASQLDALLAEHGINRVIFDSRPLYSRPPSDEYEERSQTRKPKLPIRLPATGSSPFLRLVGRNDVETTTPWIEEWSAIVAECIEAGLKPFVFTHTPDDRWAPEFALRFQNAVAKQTKSPSRSGFEYESPKQLKLF